MKSINWAKKPLKRPSPKRSMIILGCILVAAVAGLIIWNHYAWRSYVTANDARYSQIRKDIIDRLSRVETRDDIRDLATEIDDSRTEVCRPSAIVQLRAAWFPDAKRYRQDCQAKLERLNDVSVAARQLHNRLLTETAVAEVYKSVSTELKQAALDDYAAYKKIWNQAEVDLLKVEADESSERAIKAQQAAIQAISKRYSDIIEADKSKQRTQFDDAAVELRDAYGRLETLKQESSSSYRGLTTALYDAVDSL